MRKALVYIICLTLISLGAGTLWAKDKYTVAILPFAVHSAENIDYIKQGVEEMLTARLSATEKITVIKKADVRQELQNAQIKDIDSRNVMEIGKKITADYVIWGSITKIGNSISLDGKLTNIEQAKSGPGISSQSLSLDDVIPKINDFSENIISHILGTAPPAQAAVSATSPGPSAASRESQIIAGMRSGGRKAGTLTSVINAEFINAPSPFKRQGFWMSQKIPTELKGMDIGDVNNDGANEIVLIDKNTVYIYQKTQDNLKLLETIKGASYETYRAVDIADINRNGVNEIFVTVTQDTFVKSFVLEFKDSKYEKIASGIPLFLRVIDTPSGMPLLLGQELGFGKPFDTPIYEVIWKDKAYVTDQKMQIPQGLSVYGLNIDNVGTGGGGEKILALDDLDYLYIIDKTTKSLPSLTSFGFASEKVIWRSEDVYGGSNNFIENLDKNNPDDPRAKSAYINLRILTADTNNDGKKEIIIVKNLSSTARLLKQLKLFTASEIYNLEWDGLGMAENWRTKKINGYVADYAIKDVDNDGRHEIVLAMVMSVGVSLRDRSVLVVYELDTPQQ